MQRPEGGFRELAKQMIVFVYGMEDWCISLGDENGLSSRLHLGH